MLNFKVGNQVREYGSFCSAPATLFDGDPYPHPCLVMTKNESSNFAGRLVSPTSLKYDWLVNGTEPTYQFAVLNRNTWWDSPFNNEHGYLNIGGNELGTGARYWNANLEYPSTTNVIMLSRSGQTTSNQKLYMIFEPYLSDSSVADSLRVCQYHTIKPSNRITTYTYSGSHSKRDYLPDTSTEFFSKLFTDLDTMHFSTIGLNLTNGFSESHREAIIQINFELAVCVVNDGTYVPSNPDFDMSPIILINTTGNETLLADYVEYSPSPNIYNNKLGIYSPTEYKLKVINRDSNTNLFMYSGRLGGTVNNIGNDPYPNMIYISMPSLKFGPYTALTEIGSDAPNKRIEICGFCMVIEALWIDEEN